VARKYTPKNESQNTAPSIWRWWKPSVKKDGDLAKQVFDTVLYIEQDQKDRRERNLRCMKLYSNADLSNLGPYGYSQTNTSPNLPENRVKYNIVTSATDTLSAKISKMKPKVSFLTGGGQFHVQERAKKLEKFTVGAFYANKIYGLHQQCFRDSLIFDLGAIKHYRMDGKICSERVFPFEIYVDAADAMYGKPTHIYHVKFVHKEMLAEMYPDSRAAIMESTGTLDPTSARSSVNQQEEEYCVIVEAWHLKSNYEDADDGRHVICVEKGVILDEAYDRPTFPFTFMTWSNPIVGFYGQSLCDRLTSNQIEINKMLRIIQRSFHLGSAFKVFLEYGSKVAKEHINNEIGSLVYYSGTKPEFYVPKVVHEEFFQHLEWLIKSSYEEAGISQLSSAAKLPPGIDGGSGKALRTYNDLETERFILTSQSYEASFLETATQYIDLAREAYEAGEDLKVTAESKKFVESIKWSEVDLEHDQYIMQMFPTSSLPSTPSGRLAYIQELIQAQIIPPEFALTLLEFPDIEGYAALKTAPLDDLMDTLDQMLYKGKFSPPEPFQNLKLGITTFQSAYLKAKKDGAPDDRLEMIRTWIAMADVMVNPVVPGLPVGPQGAPGAPMAPLGLQPPMDGGGAPPPPGMPPSAPPAPPMAA
jgi:hypothetical protein